MAKPTKKKLPEFLKNIDIQEFETNDDFEIMYNALSVGWHLRKIAEINPMIVSSEAREKRFLEWLGRHLAMHTKSNYGQSK